ncbi:hypothetical protein GX48_08338, partial [Paracoccidioides brasiliensis]
ESKSSPTVKNTLSAFTWEDIDGYDDVNTEKWHPQCITTAADTTDNRHPLQSSGIGTVLMAIHVERESPSSIGTKGLQGASAIVCTSNQLTAGRSRILRPSVASIQVWKRKSLVRKFSLPNGDP